MFNNDCGSTGGGAFAFCNGAYAKPIIPIPSVLGELVLGLRVPDNTNGLGFNWVYSGTNTRNGNPLPTGYAQVLMQLTLAGSTSLGSFSSGGRTRIPVASAARRQTTTAIGWKT